MVPPQIAAGSMDLCDPVLAGVDTAVQTREESEQ